MSGYILSTQTLLIREVVRFLRQRHRIVGALGTPLVFWFLIGSGLGGSFRHTAGIGDLNYLQYFFPGTVVLILLFTAIFSTISIIEDRREGFLQSVLVAPIPRSSFVLGKILGGTLLAFGQALLFVAMAPLLRVSVTPSDAVFVLAILFLMAFGLTGLGFLIAWRMDSTQGFHAVMNLFLMPLWFLSGALFPTAGAPTWLKWAMTVNPLTYSVSALHLGFFNTGGAVAGAPSRTVCFAVTLAFAAAMFAASAWAARSSGKR